MRIWSKTCRPYPKWSSVILYSTSCRIWLKRINLSWIRKNSELYILTKITKIKIFKLLMPLKSNSKGKSQSKCSLITAWIWLILGAIIWGSQTTQILAPLSLMHNPTIWIRISIRVQPLQGWQVILFCRAIYLLLRKKMTWSLLMIS